MSPIVRAVMIACLAGVLASACDDAPAPESKPGGAKPQVARPATAAALVPPNMVSAVSASKVASQVGVHFALESAPAVGKPLAVNLAIIPHREFTAMRVHFETPEGVILATGESFEAPGSVKAETVFTHKVVVQPSQEGVFLITAAVDTYSEDTSVVRIYSIPVIVYGDQPATPPAAAPTPTPTPPAG